METVGGAGSLIALITNPDGDSDGDGTSNIYELLKATGGAENLLHTVEGLGGDMDILSQLMDHVGGPHKLLDLFAGLGDEDGAYVHAQLGDEGLEIDIELLGVGHMSIRPASEGTDLSRFWEAEVRFRKRIRLGPQATREGGDGSGCKGVVGEIAWVVGGAVGAGGICLLVSWTGLAIQ